MTRYTPWVVSEHVPDFSTLANLVASPRFAGKTGEDLAVALWQVMVDDELGIFHYFPAQERLWGKDVYDPLKVLNVYGFTICHIHANVLAMLGRAAGFETRIANVTGHEGTEFFYDGSWHYFDADIQMFHRLRPPDDGVIASREQLHADPTLVSDQPNPSFPYHMPDRLPEVFCKAYESEPAYPDVLEERVHSMDFRLRPGESMTRWFHHRGRWVSFPTYPGAFARYPNETGPEGPTERFWPRRQWGNGVFRYAPRLSAAYGDVEAGADEVSGLSLTDAGLVCDGDAGAAVFAFESPYIYCGVPDPMRRLPAVDGAVVVATFDLPAGSAAKIEVAPDGADDWREVWSARGAGGEVGCEADFTELAEARYRLRLRLSLTGAGAALRSFETRLWFMVSPHSLPALKVAGGNRMRVHFGDRFGLCTRPVMVEALTAADDWAGGVFATENLRHDPSTYARLLPVDAGAPWRAVYELTAPAGGTMAWATAYALIEGRKGDEDPGAIPATIELADRPDGPWRTVAEREIVEHERGWHFGVIGEGRFSGDSPTGYVRFSARKGAAGFRIMGHYEDKPAPAPSPTGAPGHRPEKVPDPFLPPMEIEHAWYEVHEDVGRRLHTHVETVAGGDGDYVVHCDRQPHDESIVLRVPSAKKA